MIELNIKKVNFVCNYMFIELIGLYIVVLNWSVIIGIEKC